MPDTTDKNLNNQDAILDVGKGLVLTQSPFTEKTETDTDIDKIIAINTQQNDFRMFVQQSVFTMYGSSKPLEEYEGREEFLRKYTIPAESKRALWVSVQQLGIKESGEFNP